MRCDSLLSWSHTNQIFSAGMKTRAYAQVVSETNDILRSNRKRSQGPQPRQSRKILWTSVIKLTQTRHSKWNFGTVTWDCQPFVRLYWSAAWSHPYVRKSVDPQCVPTLGLAGRLPETFSCVCLRFLFSIAPLLVLFWLTDILRASLRGLKEMLESRTLCLLYVLVKLIEATNCLKSLEMHTGEIIIRGCQQG